MRGMGLRQQDVDGVLSEVFCFEKKRGRVNRWEASIGGWIYTIGVTEPIVTPRKTSDVP